MTERRIKNILKRMLDGDVFYTNASPRITNAEITELWDLGFAIQKEALYGAESPTPWIVYPLHKEDFKKKAEVYLFALEAGKIHAEG